MNKKITKQMNKLIECKDCKRFKKSISVLNITKRILGGISAMEKKIDDEKVRIEKEFYNHFETHLSREEKK